MLSRKSLRVLTAAWGLFLLLLIPSGASLAADYPTRNVDIIVPWGPGSNADLLARILAPLMDKKFKQPFVVVNKTGAAGILAHNYVANAKPDGYNLLSLNSVYGGLIATRKPGDLKFQFDSFIPIIGYAETHVFFHVKADAPWKNFRELVEDAGRNPGKVKYSSYGNFGLGHIVATDVFKRAGVKVTHIPQNTSGDAMTALLGGHVQMASILGSAGHIAGGTARALAVCTAQRRPDFPDVPTLKELGYDVIRPSIVGFAVPKGTPQEIVDKLYKGTQEILTENREEIRQKFINLEAIPTMVGPADFWGICQGDKVYIDNITVQIRKELGVRE
jgi:tripartite-type tricarboxylate transporter receptor subunit TctC